MNDHTQAAHGNRRTSVPVKIAVRLCGRSMKLGDFLNWNAGSVIEFDKSIEAPLAICAGDKVIGTGQAVTIGSRIGLRLRQVGAIDLTSPR